MHSTEEAVLSKDLVAPWAATLRREWEAKYQDKECVFVSLGYAEPEGPKQRNARA